jgi:hypothetical protein
VIAAPTMKNASDSAVFLSEFLHRRQQLLTAKTMLVRGNKSRMPP